MNQKTKKYDVSTIITYDKIKKIFIYTLLFLITNTLFAQSISLPYYTGFDSPDERAGWQQFRTGFLSLYKWENNGKLFHGYNVGGNLKDTIIDWYVSPPLNFTSSGKMTMNVITRGFSNPESDNCEIWFGTNNPNPSSGNFILIANLSYIKAQDKWVDTTINIPVTSADSGYVAFKYKIIGDAWRTYSIDSITISTTVGIDETEYLNKETIEVIPNPLISVATVYFDSKIQNGQLNLYNIHGQRVKSITNIRGLQYKLYRGDLTTGVYMLSLSQDNIIIATRKVIITD